MLELTTEAERRHLHCLRLDTRNDLIEARALYSKLGFQEVPAFNEGPYAQHWFQLDLE
jgi:ribosomal protein S18 acetylase RimI-like enzyme